MRKRKDDARVRGALAEVAAAQDRYGQQRLAGIWADGKPRPSGEKTMELGPGPREGTQGSGLTLQANAGRSGAVPGPKGGAFDGWPAPDVVLRGGHAAYILIENVEKPTDNSSASLLC
jgi:hypothetical protein